MKISLLVAGASLVAFALPAAAQETGWYGDIGYQHISADGGAVDADVGAIAGHLGYNFTENLAVEGELAAGIDDEDIGGGVSLGLNYAIGAYGRVQAPIGENFTIFARAGIVNAEFEAEGAGVTASDSETGAGYGVGAEFHFDGVNGVRLDYTRYDIEDLEADAFFIGYSRRF